MPDFIPPQLCKTLEKPPSGPGWAHEIKFDGYRMQLRTVSGKATLLSRNGLDWSTKFPEIVKSGTGLANGIIDGEVVALDHTGAPDFAALQAAISDAKTRDLVFFRFRPVVRRRGRPAVPRLVGSQGLGSSRTLLRHRPIIRYVDHFITAGDARVAVCLPHGSGGDHL